MRTAERPTEAGPVFVRVLGPAFMKLPDTVQRLHLRQGRARRYLGRDRRVATRRTMDTPGQPPRDALTPVGLRRVPL